MDDVEGIIAAELNRQGRQSDDPLLISMLRPFVEAGISVGFQRGFNEVVTSLREQLDTLQPTGEFLSEETGIDVLNFSIRTYNCLKREGVHTIANLLQCTDQNLMDIRNLGKQAIKEIDGKLAAHGHRRSSIKL